ncbi:MAG: hypothetical protein R2854_29935 [Caldilineaceae bacterium]
MGGTGYMQATAPAAAAAHRCGLVGVMTLLLVLLLGLGYIMWRPAVDEWGAAVQLRPVDLPTSISAVRRQRHAHGDAGNKSNRHPPPHRLQPPHPLRTGRQWPPATRNDAPQVSPQTSPARPQSRRRVTPAAQDHNRFHHGCAGTRGADIHPRAETASAASVDVNWRHDYDHDESR